VQSDADLIKAVGMIDEPPLVILGASLQPPVSLLLSAILQHALRLRDGTARKPIINKL